LLVYKINSVHNLQFLRGDAKVRQTI
jgi:hypothetical protein